MRKWNEDPPHIAHFLIRLLFCLFAEDAGLLPKDVFTDLVERTRRNPNAFGRQLRQLFAEMASGGWFGSQQIAHFDGRLFDDDTVLELPGDGMGRLLFLRVWLGWVTTRLTRGFFDLGKAMQVISAGPDKTTAI